ncbi:DNA-binding response regulator, OmpR family, contains REC and winged-helix (wHTH) domain [Oscillospiraceae bacterium]|nr:DNA-binding response regulator, OmpR family, contains REC and winged-helix (wHTH) domain [Oscillospiraceae bacterium]
MLSFFPPITMKKILIVDDDTYINEMVQKALTSAGYSVVSAFSGTEALLVLKSETPDLILLDLMLPGLSGEELLPLIKDIPVIVVSAKIDHKNKVDLLVGGACDYITKPFELDELLARIRIHLRGATSRRVQQEEDYIAGDIVLDPNKLTVTVGENSVSLTRTECAILKLLMQNEGRPLGRNTILDEISESTPDCTERSLKQHMSNIRKKLSSLDEKDHIEAVYGIGFKFKS